MKRDVEVRGATVTGLKLETEYDDGSLVYHQNLRSYHKGTLTLKKPFHHQDPDIMYSSKGLIRSELKLQQLFYKTL